MSAYTIIVEFLVNSQDRTAFLERVTANAATSLRDEPGCERFDVLVPKDQADRIVLYEIYRDKAAFDDHCRSPHFHAFDKAVAGMVREKRLIELDLVGLMPTIAPSLATGL
ncbi:putative quinol monooxygenase [Chelatococcus sp. GCM10030263]|uniref:putative quinol monooxygenase n=1 Tax=Chelatococcus sp. GCM10030263 TaxID=3273387 RepID=UPI0036104C23